MNNLSKIDEITRSLPDLSCLVVSHSIESVEYKVWNEGGEDSTAKAVPILSEESVGIMRFYMKKGETINVHVHDNEAEGIIVVSGCFVTYINGKKRIVGAGEAVYYAPKDEHYGTVLQDLDCICVTVPRASGYPNGN